MNKKAFDILKERGYVYQATDETRIKELLNSEEKQTFYLGIDPTANSLHIGHFFALTMVRRLQELGHHPIIVVLLDRAVGGSALYTSRDSFFDR